MSEDFMHSASFAAEKDAIEKIINTTSRVRSKFRLQSVTQSKYSKDWPAQETFTFNAVCADEVEENQRYHKYTPNGTLTITIDNPPAQEFFVLGEEYYLDFTKV